MIGLTALGCIRASQLLTKSLLKPLRRTALIMEHIGTPDDIRNKVPPVYSELRPLVEKYWDKVKSSTIRFSGWSNSETSSSS